MKGRITKRVVDGLRVHDTRKEITIWDADVKGFGVRARAGGACTYIVRYRPGGGRGAPLRTFTIGRHGSPWAPDEARREAKRLLGLVEDGADPAGARMRYREAPTVTELANRFLTEHVDPKCKPRTAAEYRHWINRIILPSLGARRVEDVTFGDISKLHHEWRSTPYQANHAIGVLSKMMNLASNWGMRTDGFNPCKGITRFPEKTRERMLSAEELARLADALAEFDGSPYIVAAIKLLVFTGARLSEILGLRWEWVDFNRGAARLPDSKTGTKTIYLPPPALEVLHNLKRISGNPYVIVGGVIGAALVNLEKPWRRIRERASVLLWSKSANPTISQFVIELSAELNRKPRLSECLAAAEVRTIPLPHGFHDVRLHDLRHAFASIAASRGMGLPIIGKMLGHTQPATTHRYAHLAPDPVKAAVTCVASEIEAAMNSLSGSNYSPTTLWDYRLRFGS